MNKYSVEDYKEKCKSIGLTYIGNHKEYHKGTVIEYICNKHKDKGVQNTDWGHLRTYKQCPYCSGRYRTNEEAYSLIKNKNVILESVYVGLEKPIQCRCKRCGHKWETTPKVLITNGGGGVPGMRKGNGEYF